MQYYAHTPSEATNQWHDLRAHLEAVAKLAQSFAAYFNGAELGCWAGLLHDLGKFNPDFQAYLKAQHEGSFHRKVPHSIWGAAVIYLLMSIRDRARRSWWCLSPLIAGHHGGLSCPSLLDQTLVGVKAEELAIYCERLRELPILPPLTVDWRPGTRQELFLRMVFSALVDADYLDTEKHFHPEAASERNRWPSLEELWRRFEHDQRHLLTHADDSLIINRIRREVYESCLACSAMPPGIFRLTVPTGGGKTRSGLAFALRHALVHGLRRIIVALPYTSIIEQTASVYREILGDGAVLEHHSQLTIPEGEGEDEPSRLRLSAQNWEAPLVVTTTVQLFESLFANRPEKVRKLHNLAKSVIVLDEVQTLPPHLLQPTLDVLQTLVEEYGVSIVLSTATQPALESTLLKSGVGLASPVCEIVPEYKKHFAALRRVEYSFRKEPISWLSLAEGIKQHKQVLVIVNSRKDALAILHHLGPIDGVYHLSTLLCGAHRRQVLKEVKERLCPQEGGTVRLISTQVVEAGVDLDFPIVYRAIGPLDRIVQAAGRCNREGRAATGEVIIFDPEEGSAPRGPYKQGMEKARFLLHEHPVTELHNPEIYLEYFQLLFSDINMDPHRIQEYREQLNYPEVARRYRMIEGSTVSVVVPYGDGMERLARWLHVPTWEGWLRLQPYLVSLYEHEAMQFAKAGLMEPVAAGLYRWLGSYDDWGIGQAVYDPSDLVVGRWFYGTSQGSC